MAVEYISILPDGVENGLLSGLSIWSAKATGALGGGSRAKPFSMNASKSSIAVPSQNSRSHSMSDALSLYPEMPRRSARSVQMSMSFRHSYIGSMACFMKIA